MEVNKGVKFKHVAFLVIVLALVGCAPKVKVIDEEAIKSFEAVKQKDELYLQGFKEGTEACNAAWFFRLQSEVEDLKRQKLWSKYVKGGYVKPPLIAEIYVPPEVSEDGKSYKPARIEYVILEDAKFVSENLLQRLSKKTVIVFLGLFYTNDALEKRKAEVEKHLKEKGWEEAVWVEVLLAASGSGKALVVKSEDYAKAKVIAEELGGEVIQ